MADRGRKKVIVNSFARKLDDGNFYNTEISRSDDKWQVSPGRHTESMKVSKNAIKHLEMRPSISKNFLTCTFMPERSPGRTIKQSSSLTVGKCTLYHNAVGTKKIALCSFLDIEGSFDN